MRTFAYCRVSTAEQTTENQMLAIRNAGYAIPDTRVIEETISGGVPAMERSEFARLIDRMEEEDQLVVLKLDRLGRDCIDIQQTINMLMDRGIKVVSLDLPVSDLSSAEGQLMLQLLSSFAQFERWRLRERTMQGLERAKAEGKKLGRPVATDTTVRVQACKAEGLSQSKTAERLGVTTMTVKRHWNKEA